MTATGPLVGRDHAELDGGAVEAGTGGDGAPAVVRLGRVSVAARRRRRCRRTRRRPARAPATRASGRDHVRCLHGVFPLGWLCEIGRSVSVRERPGREPRLERAATGRRGRGLEEQEQTMHEAEEDVVELADREEPRVARAGDDDRVEHEQRRCCGRSTAGHRSRARAPRTEPKIVPTPPMITMATNVIDRNRLKMPRLQPLVTIAVERAGQRREGARPGEGADLVAGQVHADHLGGEVPVPHRLHGPARPGAHEVLGDAAPTSATTAQTSQNRLCSFS